MDGPSLTAKAAPRSDASRGSMPKLPAEELAKMLRTLNIASAPDDLSGRPDAVSARPRPIGMDGATASPYSGVGSVSYGSSLPSRSGSGRPTGGDGATASSYSVGDMTFRSDVPSGLGRPVGSNDTTVTGGRTDDSHSVAGVRDVPEPSLARRGYKTNRPFVDASFPGSVSGSGTQASSARNPAGHPAGNNAPARPRGGDGIAGPSSDRSVPGSQNSPAGRLAGNNASAKRSDTRISPVGRSSSGHSAGNDAAPTKYPSWKEKQAGQVASKSSKRSSARGSAGKKRVSIPPGSEPSLISGYLLMMFGALDDLLDFAVGYFPGVTTVLATMSSIAQMIIIWLDPNMRRQTPSDRFKLLMKRWAIIAVAGLIEGLFIVFNLLPLQSVAAFLIRYVRTKDKTSKT